MKMVVLRSLFALTAMKYLVNTILKNIEQNVGKND